MHKKGVNEQKSCEDEQCLDLEHYNNLVKEYANLREKFELYKKRIDDIYTEDISYFSNRNICLQKEIEEMLGRLLRIRVVGKGNNMTIDIPDLIAFFRKGYGEFELSVDSSSLLLEGGYLEELLDGGKEYELTAKLIRLKKILKIRDANSLSND